MFFVKVLRFVEKDIGGRMKTLRTDWGKEFYNDEFELLLEWEDVICETNTSYTP